MCPDRVAWKPLLWTVTIHIVLWQGPCYGLRMSGVGGFLCSGTALQSEVKTGRLMEGLLSQWSISPPWLFRWRREPGKSACISPPALSDLPPHCFFLFPLYPPQPEHFMTYPCWSLCLRQWLWGAGGLVPGSLQLLVPVSPGLCALLGFVCSGICLPVNPYAAQTLRPWAGLRREWVSDPFEVYWRASSEVAGLLNLNYRGFPGGFWGASGVLEEWLEAQLRQVPLLMRVG